VCPFPDTPFHPDDENVDGNKLRFASADKPVKFDVGHFAFDAVAASTCGPDVISVA
jgi:hypothetical protein